MSETDLMNSEQRIQQRIAGRTAAAELFSLIDGHSASIQFLESLMEEFKRLIEAIHPPLPMVSANEPQPIGRLGATVMPFGAHAGKTFDDTPLDYLDWLCRSQEEFYRGLRSYLTHPELESRRRVL